MTSPHYHLSDALNPRFKLRYGARVNATTIEDHLVVLCPEMHPNDQASETMSSPSVIFLLRPSHCDSATEVASYLAEPVIVLSSNPLMFWKNLCLPATSAPVERVFLKARNITKADRSLRMSSSLLKKMVLLACNSQ